MTQILLTCLSVCLSARQWNQHASQYSENRFYKPVSNSRSFSEKENWNRVPHFIL